jgi:hypothetical protein
MARTAVLERLNWKLGEVVELIDETPRVRSITLDIPEWTGHRAGQHAEVEWRNVRDTFGSIAMLMGTVVFQRERIQGRLVEVERTPHRFRKGNRSPSEGSPKSSSIVQPPGAQMSYPLDDFSEHWPHEWAAIRLLAVHPSARGGRIGRALTQVGVVTIGGHRRSGDRTSQGEGDGGGAVYVRAHGVERAREYDFRPGPTILVEAYRLMLT